MKLKSKVKNARIALAKVPKVALSLVTIGLVLGSSSSISFAGMVLLESDRMLEYNYAWKGHDPHVGEAESVQIASRELLGTLNRMANISEFDNFAGTNVERTLSNKFEKIGELLRNTTAFTDSKSSSSGGSATQRGLVVSVQTFGFKPGTYYNQYKRDPWTGKRDSKAGGTLQCQLPHPQGDGACN